MKKSLKCSAPACDFSADKANLNFPRAEEQVWSKKEILAAVSGVWLSISPHRHHSQPVPPSSCWIGAVTGLRCCSPSPSTAKVTAAGAGMEKVEKNFRPLKSALRNRNKILTSILPTVLLFDCKWSVSDAPEESSWFCLWLLASKGQVINTNAIIKWSVRVAWVQKVTQVREQRLWHRVL